MPQGDYTARGCYNCHKQTQVERHWLSRHDERTACRDCHPPHKDFRAALPVALLPHNTSALRLRGYDWQLSNESCLRCHSPNTLFGGATARFSDPTGLSYHELHLARGESLCIECHESHGSTQSSLLRRRLLTGETFGVLPTPSGGNCTVSCHGVDHVSWRYGAARQ
jgi:predicted CXXCH cytochrome family protein